MRGRMESRHLGGDTCRFPWVGRGVPPSRPPSAEAKIGVCVLFVTIFIAYRVRRFLSKSQSGGCVLR